MHLELDGGKGLFDDISPLLKAHHATLEPATGVGVQSCQRETWPLAGHGWNIIKPA